MNKKTLDLRRQRPALSLLLLCATSAGGFGVLTLGTGPAYAEERIDGTDPADREMQAEAPDRPKDMPLSLLPEPPSLRLEAPRPAALEAIDSLLAQLVDKDPNQRSRAQRSLLGAKTDWVSGIHLRADRLADRSDRNAMKLLFEKIRDTTPASPSGNNDYLSDVLQQPQLDSEEYRALVQLMGLERMLTAIGTTEAARELIFIYSRFGEFIRIDVQRQLDELAERSTAALIEAQRHPAIKIQEWAKRLLRLQKRSDAREAVLTEDTTAQADILIALGRTRDPDVAALLISFAATDRASVRLAARQGLALLGEVAAWQLKDAYQDITGKTPPRDWTWKRTARELFTEYDRLRMEEAYALFAQAQQAREQKDWAKMREAYDKIVAKLPSFPKNEELAQGYLEAAEAEAQLKPDSALSSAFRAERLAPDEKTQKKAEALRRLLQARKLLKQNWIDQGQLEKVRTLDPEADLQSEESQAALPQASTWGARSRYLVAFAVAAIALAGAAWIFVGTFLRRRSEGRPEKTIPQSEAPASNQNAKVAPSLNNAPDSEKPNSGE